MQLFNFNWTKLIIWLTPYDLRKIKSTSYLLALIKSIKILYADFLLFRNEQLYDLQINGQVINLERVLNDIFDASERRIFISEGEYFEPPIFYEEWKNKPVVFRAEGHSDNPVFWSAESIGNRIDFNFYVNIPNEVWHDRQRVRALVNKYKIFGRTFNVKQITS